jgi:ubiquitin-protein ligase
MEVNIKSTLGQGSEIKMEVQPTESVREVGDRVAAKLIIDRNSMALHFNGKPLDENKRLNEFDIKDGDTLYVMARHLRGAISLNFFQSKFQPFETNMHLPKKLQDRIETEYSAILKNRKPIRPANNNPLFWRATIHGGGNRPGAYEASMQLTREYPDKPPITTWLTPLSRIHPNIFSENGFICLNILKEGEWNGNIHSLITVHAALGWLLQNPNYEHGMVQVDNSVLETAYLDRITEPQIDPWKAYREHWKAKRNDTPAIGIFDTHKPAVSEIDFSKIDNSFAEDFLKPRQKNNWGRL